MFTAVENALYPVVCSINSYLSNYILVFLLIAVGFWYSIRTRFVQVRCFGAIFVAVCLFFFAFSTVLSWNLFGKINVIYLFGRKNAKVSSIVYTLIAMVFIFAGTMMSNDLVWELTDLFNNLMVLPNALALFALTGTVVAIANRAAGRETL